MTVLSGRIIFDIALLMLAALGLWQSRTLPTGGGISAVGPADFPTAVCALGIVAMLAVLVQDIRARTVTADDERMGWRQVGAVIGVAMLLALYVGLLEPLGFFAATGGFLAVAVTGCAYALAPAGSPPPLKRIALIALVVAAVATVLTYLVFSRGFGLVFP